MRLFLTLALLTLARVGSAQVYFNQQIDWEHDYDYLSGVISFGDSNAILVAGGNNGLFSHINHFLVSRLTDNGSLQWSRSFLPRPNASGNTASLLKLNETNSIIYGNSYLGSASPPNYQLFLIKVHNETGDTVWVKELGNNNYEEGGYELIKTTDGGFAIMGYYFPVNSAQRARLTIHKTDSLGNLQFRKEYTTDASKNHQAYSLIQTTDGGYLIFGFSSYEGPYLGGVGTAQKLDMVLIKTDAQGNQQWVKVYPPWEWKQILFYGLDLAALPNGDFLMAGLKSYAWFEPGNTYSGNFFFARLSPNGSILDSVTLPERHVLNRINRLKPCSDGNFWAIGAEKDSQNLGQTGLIMKITPELEVRWKREYRVSPPESMLHEMFYEAVEMPDKGFVLCGTAFGPLEDSTNQNGWIIRVDSFGCLEPGCQLNSPVEDPPAQEQDIGILLSPNPTTSHAHLSLTHEGAVLLGLRVLDLQGRVISDMQYKRSAGWREEDIDLAGQPSGTYILQLRTSEGMRALKILKQ
jgi:hypothetical protein